MGGETEKKKIVIKRSIVVLAVMILLQICFVSYYFINVKENYHSDEPWSYGLANSFYQPFLFGGDHDGYCSLNAKAWLTGEDLHNYLTVQKGERFRFDSVWYNQELDVHPPFYYCLLHIICSLFPDSFSNWYSYIINIAAMIIGQIFLFKSASRLCKSDVTALIICAVWGFSRGFVNLNVYLRMYSLLTMLAIVFLYCHIRLYLSEGSFKGNLIKTGAVTLLAALTHHYFLAFAFIWAACFCFYFLFSKKFTELIRYAYTMIITVMISLAVFPITIVHMFFDNVLNHGSEFKMPLLNGIRACLSLVVNSVTGGRVSVWSTGTYMYWVIAIVALAAVMVPLGFLFRKEEWFKSFTGKVKNGIVYFFKHFDFMLLFIVISSLFCMSAVALSVNINSMGMYTDRYLFFIMPQLTLAAAMAIKYVLSVIPKVKKAVPYIMTAAACASVVCSNLYCDKRYLFPANIEGSGGVESTCDENSSYLLLSGYPWQMVCYADKLMDCSEVFVSSVYRYKENIEEFRKINRDNNCYIIIDTEELAKPDSFRDNEEGMVNDELHGTILFDDEVFNKMPTEDDVISYFEDVVFPGNVLEYYGSEDIFGGEVKIYRLVG
ncbi:MAG: glycosyltransferase 87 family protein [Huintestinicola sp.]